MGTALADLKERLAEVSDISRAAAVLARNRFAPIAFHDRDHGDGRADCLAWLEERLAAEGVRDADGEIWLQTYPRVIGYAFKPVSFWHCERPDGSLAAIVVEVNNTFGERHCYLLHGADLAYGHELHAAKVFHVSPFCSVEGDYRFRFMRTGTRSVARVDHHDAEGALLHEAFFGMPLMTFGVIARIHWQALRLWVKRVPFFSKPAAPRHFLTR
jgi:DUF1365 family protein